MDQASTTRYPPTQHILRDLQLEVEHRPAATVTARIPINEHLTTQSGTVHPGALATLVDVVGGSLAASVARPGWIATSDLTLHLLRATDVKMVEARGHVLRKGRTTVVIEVILSDQRDQNLGSATMSFAVLQHRDDNPVIETTDAVSRMSLATDGSGFDQPLEEKTGLTTVDAAGGVIELPISDYIRNSLGAVQGGMIAMTVSAAAERALTGACGAPVEAIDLQISYLSLAKSGPIRSSVQILETTPTFGCARVELTDLGADGRVTTLARVTAVLPEQPC